MERYREDSHRHCKDDAHTHLQTKCVPSFFGDRAAGPQGWPTELTGLRSYVMARLTAECRACGFLRPNAFCAQNNVATVDAVASALDLPIVSIVVLCGGYLIGS